MNKLGLHICYLRGTAYEFDMPAAIRLVKASGADILEVSTGTIIEFSREERLHIKKCAEEAGLVLTANGGLNAKNDISADDAAVRRTGVDYLKRVLEAVHEIGADIFCGINYTAWLRHPESLLTKDEKERIWDLSVQGMRQVIKTAEGLGITYCFEIVNRYEEFLLNTAAEGVTYAEQVGSPNAKLLLDTFHMNMEENDMLSAMSYAMEKGRLGHFHAGESNRRIPGLGPANIRWSEVFSTLKGIGYGGHIVMEPFVRMGLPTSMNTCVWRDMTNNTSLDEYMRDVSRGFDFLRNGLA